MSTTAATSVVSNHALLTQIADQLSNLDEEDLRAIIAYVRLLPPVDRIVPPARPPAADDCDTYTFYLTRSDQPGCR